MHNLANDIQNIISKRIGEINTLDIGIIKNINDNNTCDLYLIRKQNNITNLNTSDENNKIIELYDVPIMRTYCRNFSISPDYQENDKVLIGYTKTDIYNQLISESSIEVSCNNYFNITNAIVIGNVPSWDIPIPQTTQNEIGDVTIQHSSGSKIVFKSDGEIDIIGTKIKMKYLT